MGIARLSGVLFIVVTVTLSCCDTWTSCVYVDEDKAVLASKNVLSRPGVGFMNRRRLR